MAGVCIHKGPISNQEVKKKPTSVMPIKSAEKGTFWANCWRTRANTGHAMLQSTSKPPKMKRRNGPSDGWTDGRTDRPSYRGALLHLKISHDLLSGALTSMHKQYYNDRKKTDHTNIRMCLMCPLSEL